MAHAHEPLYSHYGPDEGLPDLRAALQRKIEEENGLRGVGYWTYRHKLLIVHWRSECPEMTLQQQWKKLGKVSTNMGR